VLNNLSDQIVLNLKNMIIHIFSFLFVVLNLHSYNFFGLEIWPYFIVMILFLWGVYNPSLFNPIYIFCIGLVYDILFDLTLGFHSFIFLVIYFVVSRQRIFLMGQNYLVVFSLFVLIAFLTYFSEWIFFSLLENNFQNYILLFYNFLATVFLFPVFNLLNIFFRNLIVLQYGVKN